MVFHEKKSVMILTGISVILLLLAVGGAVYLGITQGWALAMVSLIGLGWISILMGICAWLSYRRRIVIHDNGITFYYKLFSSTPEYNGYNRKGLHIRYDEIKALQSRFHAGDHMITGDCYEYFLYLSNGATISLYLYHFGKKNEDLIVSLLKERIK